MAFFDDVLDATGRTPRELGSVHVFVESCVRSDTGDAVLTVWAQAAFARCSGAILCADQRWPIPSLEDGQVMRARLPLKLPLEVTSIEVSADCPVKDSSQRVREAWKLTDTFAVTHTEMASLGLGGIGAALALNAVTLRLGVAILPGAAATAAVQTNVRVEKARDLPRLSCGVTSGTFEPLSAASWETAWSVGAALPAKLESNPERWAEQAKPAEAAAEPGAESPWVFAKALLNAGYPLERVRDRLVQERGLTTRDAELLLADVEQPSVAAPDDSPDAAAAEEVTRTGLNLGPVLGLGIMFVSLMVAVVLPTPVTVLTAILGVVVGAFRVYFTFGAFRPRPTIDPSRLQKLTAEDPTTRCSRHAEFASLGTCSRCGTFSCRVCAPFEGFPAREVCAPCDSLPSMQLERLDRARHFTAFACLAQLSLFVVTVVIIAAVRREPSFLLTILLGLCVGLAGTQFKVNGVWPALLSLVFGFVLLIFCTGTLATSQWAAVALPVWLLWFPASAVILTMASTQRGQVRAVRAGTVQGKPGSAGSQE